MDFRPSAQPLARLLARSLARLLEIQSTFPSRPGASRRSPSCAIAPSERNVTSGQLHGARGRADAGKFRVPVVTISCRSPVPFALSSLINLRLARADHSTGGGGDGGGLKQCAPDGRLAARSLYLSVPSSGGGGRLSATFRPRCSHSLLGCERWRESRTAVRLFN